jgi:hypothetical protein
MNIDLDLELPFHSDPPEPEPRMDATRYLEFIEFNQQVMRENGTAERQLSQRSRPVDKMFSFD